MAALEITWHHRASDYRIVGTTSTCSACGLDFNHWRKGDGPLEDLEEECPMCGAPFKSRFDHHDEVAA